MTAYLTFILPPLQTLLDSFASGDADAECWQAALELLNQAFIVDDGGT